MFAIMKVTQGLANALAQDEFALTARRTLALATIDGARCLGLDAVTGSLTPGKRADLIVVSPAGPNLGVLTDPAQLLVTAAQPGNVDTVIAEVLPGDKAAHKNCQQGPGNFFLHGCSLTRGFVDRSDDRYLFLSRL